MRDTRYEIRGRRGAALLVVLFIVMTITILSVGFLSRSDVELACGENMILRTQMDYLAESGLEHAKGLVLNPQDVDSEYWTGDVRQQLVAGSGDYYDVEIVRDDPNYRNYVITSDAYREKNGERIGRSSLSGELRLDPCIAYWAGADTTIWQRITINGDVYCNGSISGNGYIGGDAFASGNITAANIQGQENKAVTEAPVNWPGLDINDFSTTYYIGSSLHSVDVIDPCLPIPNPSLDNPAGVLYCPNDIELPGGVNINGMLVVNGALRISGVNNTISAVKNFPALLVSGELIMEDGGTLAINGLAQIGQRVVISSGSIDVLGALFIANGSIEGSIPDAVSIDITAAAAIAAIQIWPTPGTARRWSPAAGAFFRSIKRN